MTDKVESGYRGTRDAICQDSDAMTNQDTVKKSRQRKMQNRNTWKDKSQIGVFEGTRQKLFVSSCQEHKLLRRSRKRAV